MQGPARAGSLGPVNSPDLPTRLRTEVGRFRQGQQRRRFDLALHVGTPDGARSSVEIPAKELGYLDRQTRTELFSALVEIAPAGTDSAWLTRPGGADAMAADVAWMVAAAAAFGSAGAELTGFFAITRWGWVEVRTGESRVWRRLRLR